MSLSSKSIITASLAGNTTRDLVSLANNVLYMTGYGKTTDDPKDIANTDYCQIIEFGVGEFVIDFPVIFRCNVIIRGQGVNNTKLIFKRNMKSFNDAIAANYEPIESDDTYICVKGKKGSEVFVDISNLSMEMEQATITQANKIEFNSNDPRLLVKIYHANKVVFRNVNSRYDNFLAHNLDMRVCSNIMVENCRFTAYNNTKEGAVMAIRGNTENVMIRNNEFHKHGNDEIITFMALSDNANDSTIPQFNFKHRYRGQ